MIGRRRLPRPGGALEASGISKAYEDRPVLREVNLTVGPGQVLGVSGPSGSGKTTLLHILAGMIDPDAGSVQLGDVTLTDEDVLVETEHRNLMLVQQDAVLDRNHNVAANIAYGLPKDKRRRHVGARRVAMMMDLFELATPLADSRPQELSAGERQRVSMARAIVGFGLGGPEAAVLLDEPLSAVEPGTRVRLLRTALADIGGYPIPVLLVSHDAEEIAALAGRRAALVEGRLVHT